MGDWVTVGKKGKLVKTVAAAADASSSAKPENQRPPKQEKASKPDKGPNGRNPTLLRVIPGASYVKPTPKISSKSAAKPPTQQTSSDDKQEVTDNWEDHCSDEDVDAGAGKELPVEDDDGWTTVKKKTKPVAKTEDTAWASASWQKSSKQQGQVSAKARKCDIYRYELVGHWVDNVKQQISVCDRGNGTFEAKFSDSKDLVWYTPIRFEWFSKREVLTCGKWECVCATRRQGELLTGVLWRGLHDDKKEGNAERHWTRVDDASSAARDNNAQWKNVKHSAESQSWDAQSSWQGWGDVNSTNPPGEKYTDEGTKKGSKAVEDDTPDDWEAVADKLPAPAQTPSPTEWRQPKPEQEYMVIMQPIAWGPSKAHPEEKAQPEPEEKAENLSGWQKYTDQSGRIWFFNADNGDWFYEDDPKEWTKCDDDGPPWWYGKGTWFYQPA